MYAGLCRLHNGDAAQDDGLALGSGKRGFHELNAKDRLREDPKFSRERARYAAKWAALHPLDDLEVSLAFSNPALSLRYRSRRSTSALYGKQVNPLLLLGMHLLQEPADCMGSGLSLHPCELQS